MRQLRAALSTILVSLGILPVFAFAQVGMTESFAANRIASMFSRVGVHTFEYQNTTISNSQFDFTSYMSHPCFSIRGMIEREYCETLLGPLADLGETLRSGKLEALLRVHLAVSPVQAEDLVDGVKVMQREAEEKRMQREVSSEETKRRLSMDDRSRLVWDLCNRHFARRDEQASCYRANVRLIKRSDISVQNNISYELGRRR